MSVYDELIQQAEGDMERTVFDDSDALDPVDEYGRAKAEGRAEAFREAAELARRHL